MAYKETEADIMLRWQDQPLDFVRECLGVDKISNQQEEGLILVGDIARAKLKKSIGAKLTPQEAVLSKKTGISIRAGQGVGKDTFLSWVYLWLIFCFSSAEETAGGMITAPSAAVLYDALWREMRTWIERSKTKGYDLSQVIEIHHDRLYPKALKGICEVIGRTVQARGGGDEEAASLGGRHWMYHINAVDEASGVSDGVFKPIEGSLTEKIAFCIYIANPTQSSGHFYHTHTKFREFYECRQWDATKSTISEIVPGMKEKIERELKQYGAESNYCRVRIFGEFPISDDDTLIPLHWIMSAVGRDIEYIDENEGVAGLDVARFGSDYSALVVRRKKRVVHISKWQGQNLMTTCGRVKAAYDEGLFKMVAIDSIGVGAGVLDRLVELGVPAIGVNVSETSPFRERFDRLRDDLWWRAREWFEAMDGCIEPALELKDELIAELSGIKYKYLSNGKIKVESKDEMKKRGLASPNLADAFNLCLLLTNMGASSGWQPKRRR